MMLVVSLFMEGIILISKACFFKETITDVVLCQLLRKSLGPSFKERVITEMIDQLFIETCNGYYSGRFHKKQILKLLY